MLIKKKFKTVLLSLFLLIAGGLKAFSFELFQFSVAPKYALQYGQMNEYVLYKNGQKMSELNWPIDTVSLLGFNATMGWEMIFLETNCMWGFPRSSGIMQDSDWMNQSDYGMKTDYSESSNCVKYLGNLELRFGMNIKTWDFLYIRPYGAICYERIEFSADGGNYWYGDKSSTGLSENVPYYDSRAKTGNFDSYGTVIEYKRETFTYNLGTALNFRFLQRFSVTADFGLSIYSAINTIDHHCITKYYYLDKMEGLLKRYYLGAEVDVAIWKGLSAGTSFKFVYNSQMKGTDYKKKESDKKYSIDSNSNSAASAYYYNIEFFLRYSF